MRRRAREALVGRVPETTLRTLIKLRHGEMSWQGRILQAVRAAGREETPNGYVWLPWLVSGRLAAVVHHFDDDAERRGAYAAVGDALTERGIGFVLLPGHRDIPRQLVVGDADRDAAYAALSARLAAPEWTVGQPGDAVNRSEGGRLCLHNLQATGRPDAIAVYRLLAADTGRLLSSAESGAVVEFWPQLTNASTPRADGGTHIAGTHVAPRRNDSVAYLTPQAWADSVRSPMHWPQRVVEPSIFAPIAPIDIVYTWVDGDDPAWQHRKQQYALPAHAKQLNETAYHDSRFTSRDELRYSLRSVAMYASWVNRIFIVTDGQIPSWLDTGHPKIRMVDHKEIFTDPSALPVFNSHAIESQLHHIDGLSEQYLYMNDDFFIGRPIGPETFFFANGVAKFFLSPNTLDIDPPSRRDLPVMSAAKRNRTLILDEFGVRITNKFKHTPQPQLRSVLEEMERRHPEVFEQVARSRFRHPDDFSIPSALHHYYAFCLGRAVPAEISYRYQDIKMPDTQRWLENLARSRDADVFCLNDNDTTAEEMESRGLILSQFFEAFYPLASPYEL